MNALHFLSENFALIAGKKEGCLEKEGETMRGKMKAFKFHYEHCHLFSRAVYTVHLLHNHSTLTQYACQSLRHNSKWALHQGYGNTVNTKKRMERHSEGGPG